MDLKEHGHFSSDVQFRGSYEYYLGKISDSGRILYYIIIIFFTTGMSCLPLINVNTSFNAPGIIRPVSEKTFVSSLIAGKVEKIQCREGEMVTRGQVLITLNQRHLLDDLNQKLHEEMLVNNEMTDLQNLLAEKDTEMVSIKYRFEYNSYFSRMHQVKEELKKSTKEKERFKELYHGKFISDQEYDNLVYSESLIKSELEYLMNSTFSNWQNELSLLQYTMIQVRTAINRIQKEMEYCEIIAPVSGYLEQFTGIYEGSNIQPGVELACISPDTMLIGEMFITPTHIGSVKEGQEIIMMVDAFDYREWGTLHGTITDIPDDFILLDNRPVYKVRCKPDRDLLIMRNGLQGKLKKGMTFQARCFMARRSIFQLLVSRIDYHLNPYVAREKTLIP
ncbi:MAG: hypothetical protein AMS27_01570 [Bacteroides sp. SM23_62_1]|nr:MAG: hypothetical protein AMS27_01570 [Bacteroides sp. SM23_62_1]